MQLLFIRGRRVLARGGLVIKLVVGGLPQLPHLDHAERVRRNGIVVQRRRRLSPI
jgi:hypothetical protein